MVDSKYADLPGIAHDEPDVYETKDLPESEQLLDDIEEENEAIERIHLSANEAFNKFKGKQLSADKVDFSERISRRIRTGYDARNWELAGSGEKETPLQKYQRLKCEMSELLGDVNKLQTEKTDDANCLVSGEQVQEALKKLTDLKLEESLGPNLISSIKDPQGTQLKKLLSQIEQFKTIAHEKPESQKQSEDAIVYQFNYKPEQARMLQTSRLSELEARLKRLETVLGTSKDNLSRLFSITSKNNLVETAQHLSATASMLDSSQLDHIEGRLTALTQKLDSIAEKKANITADEEKDKMILELYDLIKNSENICKVLPATIERLKALECLHERSTGFAQTLAQIENLQSETMVNIENNKALLEGVQESFALNLENINKSVLNLDARIKAIKK